MADMTETLHMITVVWFTAGGRDREIALGEKQTPNASSSTEVGMSNRCRVHFVRFL
jgi:hypothetical protein